MQKVPLLVTFFTLFLISGCKIYSFSGASIDPKVKTLQLDNFENKASFVEPTLAPALLAAVQKQINQKTRLTLVGTNSNNADYEVSGYITYYGVSNSGISNGQASSSKLQATFHLIFKNHLDPTGKTVTPADFEDDVTTSVDFPASSSFSAVEASLVTQVTTNMSGDIFNRLFSSW